MDKFMEHIKHGRTSEAIDYFLELPVNQKIKDELLLISAQFEETESKNRKGLLSLDDYKRQVNIVNSQLVDLYRKQDSFVSANRYEKRPLRRFRIYAIVLFLGLIAVVSYLMWPPGNSSQAEIHNIEPGRFDTTEINLELWSTLSTPNSTLVEGEDLTYKADLLKRNSIEKVESIQLPPNLPSVEYFNIGRTFSENNKHEIAILYLTKAILDSATFSVAYIERGFCNRILGKYEQAVDDYSKSISLNKNQTNAYLNRGVVYFLLSDWNKAQDDGHRALQLNPKLPQVYNLLGNIHFAKEEYEQAITYYKKAIEKKALYRDAYYGLAMTYFSLQKEKEGCEAYNMALRLGISEKINPKYDLKCK